MINKKKKKINIKKNGDISFIIYTITKKKRRGGVLVTVTGGESGV